MESWFDSPLNRFLVMTVPHLVVSGVGILLAVRHWQRHSKMSLRLLFACLLLTVVLLFYPFLQLINFDWDFGDGPILWVLQSTIGLVATCFFIAASLSQRSSETELTLTAGVQASQRVPSVGPRIIGGSPPPIVPSPPPAQDTTPPDDLKTRLRTLEDLHNDGLLTDAEYQAKREEILGEV